MKDKIRIGAGSAWWGDRVEPAKMNADEGQLDYLCFETMAEATVSAAQVRARRDPTFEGYDTYLDDRMKAVLPGCMRQGTKIISNQGWINPDGAAQRIFRGGAIAPGLPLPVHRHLRADLAPGRLPARFGERSR